MGVTRSVAERPQQYVEVEALLEELARLPALHVLVILDSVYAGLSVVGSSLRRRYEGTPLVADLMGRVSRQLMTSALSDQLAADGGSDFPNNSLFTGWLVEGLRRAADGGGPDAPSPDTDQDGLLTVTELYAFVRGRVGSDSGARQTPDFGTFELDDRGSFVFRLPSER